MARGSGSVKLSIYSTFDDKGTKQAERALSQFTKKYGEVDAETGKLRLDAATQKLAEQSIELDQASQKWGEYAAKFETVGTAITKYVSGPAAALAGASIAVADQWDTSFAKVKTIMDPSEMGFEDMSTGLLDLSTASGRSASELAEAAYQAMSASVDTSKAVDFTSKAVDLSKAGFTDTATAVDTLTTIINAYGMSAEDAEKISDELVQTQNKGKTTVGELAASMGTVIPTAAAYGVNLENLNTAYVTLTKQGINTANATTYLNGMFNELADESSDVSGILRDKTGKSFSDLMADGWSLGDVMQVLSDSVGGDSTAFANLWGNMRAGKGALAIVNAGSGEFNAELQGMYDSSGNVQAALENLVTPGAKARNAINALKNTGIQLGEEFLGAAVPMLDEVKDAAHRLYEAFSNLDEGTKQNIAKAIALAAAIGPTVLAVGKFARGMQAATKFGAGLASTLARLSAEGAMSAGGATKASKAIGLLSKAMSPAAMGVGALVAAIGVGLVFALKDAYKRSTAAKKATDGLRSAVQRSIAPVSSMGAQVDEYSTQLDRNRVSLEDVQDAHAELAQKISERNDATQLEVSRLEGAKQVIEQYNGVTGLSAQQQGQLRAAVDLVNESCGTEYSVIDAANGVIADQEGAVMDTTEAIDGYIQKKQEEIRLNAMEDTLTDLYAQQAQDVQAVGDAYSDLAEAKQYAADIESGKVVGDINQANAAVRMMQARVDEANRTLDATNGSINDVETAMGNLSAATDGAAQSAGDWASAQAAVYGNLNPGELDGFAQHIDDLGYSVEDMRKLTDAELAQVTIAWRDNTGQCDSLLAQFTGTVSGRGQQAVDAYSGAISAGAPAAEAAAQALASAAETGLDTADVWTLGQQFAQGYADGIRSGQYTVTQAVTGLVSDAVAAAKAAQDSNSPSRIMREVGEWFSQGYAGGIELDAPMAAKRAAGMAQCAIDAATLPAPETRLKWPQNGSQAVSAGITRVEMAQLLRELRAGSTGPTYNITLNGATLNDNAAMRDAAVNLLTELMRVGAMQGRGA